VANAKRRGSSPGLLVAVAEGAESGEGVAVDEHPVPTSAAPVITAAIRPRPWRLVTCT
jgi:hypothetical protein